jgi:hypothetical protein
MPLSRIFAALILILVTCVLALPRCMMTTDAEGFEQADAVFRGRVTNIGLRWFSRTEPVTFTVEQSWKGVDSDRVVVDADPNYGEGYRFQSGEAYVVYAQRSEGKLYTGGCSKTSLLKNAGAQLNDLSGRNAIPITKTVSSGKASIVAVTGVTVLLLLAAGYTVRMFIKRAA